MDAETKARVVKMKKEQQRARFHELWVKFGIADSEQIEDARKPLVVRFDDFEEFLLLKTLLNDE